MKTWLNKVGKLCMAECYVCVKLSGPFCVDVCSHTSTHSFVLCKKYEPNYTPVHNIVGEKHIRVAIAWTKSFHQSRAKFSGEQISQSNLIRANFVEHP